jgi:tripartite-type tricarboxylate transporter receptor subunit TctC
VIAQWLSEHLGQPFVIENRPGAGTNLATADVVKAAPDGYTLLACAFPNAISATLYDNLKFNFIRDIAPVARTSRVPFVMVVNPSFPAQTVPEFIAYAKANPGTINFASTGTGNLTHFAGELFKMMTGLDMVHVPYRGEMQAQTDLLGGRAQVMFDPLSSAIGYIKAGKLRALAVTTSTPADVLPDLATVSQFVPGYEVDGWGGIGAPKNTPAKIIEKLNSEISACLADPIVKRRFADLGSALVPGSPAEFGKFLTDETEKWAKVIKFAGIKAG